MTQTRPPAAPGYANDAVRLGADVRHVTDADVPALTEMLVRAFFNDPLCTYLVPVEARRPKRLRFMYDIFLRTGLDRGDLILTNADGAPVSCAIWRRPGTWRNMDADNLRLMLRFAVGFGRDVMRLARLGGLVEKRHPDVPHWYLAVLGTDPSAQGKGYGSRLLRDVHATADAHAIGCYLETETADNVAFYARHRYGIQSELDVAVPSPHLWFLWRDPVPPEDPHPRGGRI